MDTSETHEAELLPGETVMRLLSIGKSTYYELIWSGKLPSKKIGRRVLVPRAALATFIESLPSGAQEDGRAS